MSLLGKDNTPEDEFKALTKLVNLAKSDKVHIWVSWKSDWETAENIENEDNENRKSIWEETQTILNKLPHNTGLFILGVSSLGVDTTFGSDADADFVEDIKKLAYPNKGSSKIGRGHIFDTAILADHRMQGNDIFVTRDKKFLKASFTSHLKDKWDILIVDPCTAVEMLSE
jgi:hypothetical protein